MALVPGPIIAVLFAVVVGKALALDRWKLALVRTTGRFGEARAG